MNRCPITYKLCGTNKYSEKGIRMIAPKLTHLNNLPYTAVELRQEAANRAKKLSIQGVQPKLSAKLNISASINTLENPYSAYKNPSNVLTTDNIDNNIKVVGEIYSSRQAWIEGALETVEKVV